MKAIRIAAFVAAALAAPLGASCFAVFIFSSGETQTNIIHAVWKTSDNRDPAWHTRAGEELTKADADHYWIITPLGNCFKGVDLTTREIPGQVQAKFMLWLRPDGGDSWNDRAPEAPDIQLTNYERSIVLLSHTIARARTEFAGQAARQGSRMDWLQFSIVIVGGITTILVSIKSLSSETKPSDSGGSQAHLRNLYFAIGISAVIFSALGTALSSINAFLSPGDAYVRAEHALVELRQLHIDLAQQVYQDVNPCTSFDTAALDDARAKKMADLWSRLKDILSSAGSGGAGGTTDSGTTGQSSTSLAGGPGK